MVALVLVVLALLATQGPTRSRTSAETEARAGSGASAEASSERRSDGTADESKARRSPRNLDPDERRRRAHVREQILDAELARASEAAREQARRRPAAASLPSSGSPPPTDEPERPPGDLTNRLEGHDELVDRLNRDFMPLASECIDEAIAREPGLAGMLEIAFEVVSDEDLGVIVDAVEFPEKEGQVVDEELHVCMRETLLSTLLPAGEVNGREGLMLTLEVGAEEE